MNRPTPRMHAACICLLAAALAVPLLALANGPSITRVEVRHQLMVTEACPSVHEQLPQELAVAWSIFGAPTEVLVDFELNGSRVVEVRTKGGQRDYHAPIRRAVRHLSCGTPNGGSYTVRFLVKFVDPDDTGQASVAILHRAAQADGPVLAMD